MNHQHIFFGLSNVTRRFRQCSAAINNERRYIFMATSLPLGVNRGGSFDASAQPIFFNAWRNTILADWNVGFDSSYRATFSSNGQDALKLSSDTIRLDSFDREGLDPSDERMINELIEYKKRHGDCHVPASSGKYSMGEREKLGVSEELATWVSRQRRRYRYLSSKKAKEIPEADQVRILLLESMGFIWTEREAQWRRSFNRLEAHKAKHGTLQVDQAIDPQLWTWMDQQRKAYRRGKLSEARTELLKELDFTFDLQETAWRQYYEKLLEYAKKHGTANAPTHGGDDTSLGFWVNRQRRHYHDDQLSQERIEALEAIGFSWDVHDEKWEHFYQELVAFHKENGHTRVPVASGPLWQWVDRQRRKLRRQANEEQEMSLESTEKIAALNKINFDWVISEDEEGRAKRLMDLTFTVDVQDQRWVDNFQKLCEFKERSGHFAIPPNDPEYRSLASWVKHQRFLYKRYRLPAERISALEEIGFVWSGQAARWDILYEQLVRFQAEHGHTRVPTKHRELYRWISRQRKALRDMSHSSKDENTALKEKADPRLLALGKILTEE